MKRPLIIINLASLDINYNNKLNYISKSKLPFLNEIFSSENFIKLEYPNNFFYEYGTSFTPSLGHLIIGSGNTILTNKKLISSKIEDLSFFNNSKLINILNDISFTSKNLHIISCINNEDACNSYSSLIHLKALVKMAKLHHIGKNQLLIDLIFTSNNIVPLIEEVNNILKEENIGQINSYCGSFYLLNYLNQEDKVKLGIDNLKHLNNNGYTNIIDSINTQYQELKKDDLSYIENLFIPMHNGNKDNALKNNDTVIFNFYNTYGFDNLIHKLQDNLDLSIFTFFKTKIKNVKYLFEEEIYFNNLLSIFESRNIKNLIVADSFFEKNVKFYLNGNNNLKHKTTTYKIHKINDIKLNEIISLEENKLNDLFLNLDKNIYEFSFIDFSMICMLSTLGRYDLLSSYLENLDSKLEKIYNYAKKFDYDLIIFSSNPSIDSSNNFLPFYFSSKHCKIKLTGSIFDVYLTILDILGINEFHNSSSKSLIIKE